jgi:hypothetical protein
MARRVAECAKSGKSISGYCRERGYDAKRFYTWKKVTEATNKQSGFVKVQTGLTVTLDLGAGVQLIDLPIESLSAVLKEIRCD